MIQINQSYDCSKCVDLIDMTIDKSIRNQLVLLSRRSGARVTEHRPERPTDWRPGQVFNPEGILDSYFTDSSAWELIANKLENEHPVEVVELRKPPGAKGYVMKVDIESGKPQLYIKLQLGSGQVIGRSFHYSNN